MSTWIQLSGAGSAGAPGSSGGSATPAGDVTLGSASSPVYLPPDNQGIVYVKITVPFTPPGPLGTWDHVTAYLVAPDDVVTNSKAVVQNPGAGNVGFFVGASGVASNIVPNFTPIPYGPFHASSTENMLVITYPAPQVPQTWRIYAVSGSTQVENALIPVNSGGSPSPNVTVSVNPAPSAVSGAEYAPVVDITTFTGQVTYGFSDGGQSIWGLNLQWMAPTSDPRYGLLGGYNIYLYTAAGGRILWGSNSKTQTSATTYAPVWPVPSVPTVLVIQLVSFDTAGRENTVVLGVTPQLQFVLETPPGTVGKEFTGVVASQSASIQYSLGKDGTNLFRFVMNWVDPSDVNFGGVYISFFNHTGSITTLWGSIGAGTQTATTPWWPITGNDTIDIRFISFDVNWQVNTYQAGVTPIATVNIVNPYGGLDPGKIDPSKLAGTLAINTGIFGVAPNSIDNASLTVGDLKVGGGGSKTTRFVVYNHAGAAIGWIGDDTANSGFVGAWFQQLYVGGTGPSGAPFTVDSGGNLSISMTSSNAGSTPFQLNLNSVTTNISNSAGTSGQNGLKVSYNSNTTAFAAVQCSTTGTPTGSFYCQDTTPATGLYAPGSVTLTDGLGHNIILSAVATAGAAGSVAAYLPVFVNNTNYKIALLTP